MVQLHLHELDLRLRRHPACDHWFLDRLAAAGVDSVALQTFLREFGLLRRVARVVDARLPGAHGRWTDMARSCGCHRPPVLEQALPGTRLAIDGVDLLQHDLQRREGALWALERSTAVWAEIWCFSHPLPNQEGIWDGYWHQLLPCAPMIADPLESAAASPAWQEGMHQALGRLSIFLDGCEAAMESSIVA